MQTRIAKDAKRFLDKSFSAKPKPFTPINKFGGECGRDCGWCERHGQHICSAVIEITEQCNLACPICYFGEKRDAHITPAEFKARLDDLLRIENGKLDVLQISGGECTLHPQFGEILDIALAHDIGRIVVNTNGSTIDFPVCRENDSTDKNVYRTLRLHRDRVEVYLQFDGFDDAVYTALRGRPMLAEKMAVLNRFNEAEIKICLAVTVCAMNLAEVPKIVKFATELKHVSGITFQRLTQVGCSRPSKPLERERLEREALTSMEGERHREPLPSVFQEDILLAIASGGLMKYEDLKPLPCSHENCTLFGFLFCTPEKVYSVADYIDMKKCKKALSNRLAFDETVLSYLRENICDCMVGRLLGDHPALRKLREFASSAGSTHGDMKVLRILVKNFMDADNFDFERARKCCAGVAVGGGRVVPFCLHNLMKMKGNK